MKETFQKAVCKHFHCSPEEYPRRVFWHCLYVHARPVAWALRSRASFFQEDLAFIAELGAVTSRGEAITELNRFYGRNLRDKNWIRRTFAIRISGKRVLRLYRRLARSRGDTDAALEHSVAS